MFQGQSVELENLSRNDQIHHCRSPVMNSKERMLQRVGALFTILLPCRWTVAKKSLTFFFNFWGNVAIYFFSVISHFLHFAANWCDLMSSLHHFKMCNIWSIVSKDLISKLSIKHALYLLFSIMCRCGLSKHERISHSKSLLNKVKCC